MSTTYYELTSRELVDVESIEGRVAHLVDGSQAWLADLTRPAWLIEAEQEAAGVADERDTIQSVWRG
jgi:hypothetical protein